MFVRIALPIIASASFLAACSAAPDGSTESTSARDPAPASVARPEAHASVPDHDASDRALNLVATIAVGVDHTVWIYEPAPGHVLLSEEARSPARPVLGELEGLDLVEIHRRLAPDAPVPQALLAAHERHVARAMASKPRAAASAPTTPLVSTDALRHPQVPATTVFDATGPCADGWFQSTFCQPTGGFQACLLDWWNGLYYNSTEINYGEATVCPINGSVVFNVSTDDNVGGSWTVNAGYFRHFSHYHYCTGLFCGDSDFDLFTTVTQASGKRFQYEFVAQSY